MSEPSQIFPIWLRDVYACIRTEPIYELEGYNAENEDIESAANTSFTTLQEYGITHSDLFLSGGDVFNYLSDHFDSNTCTKMVTIVIRGLRDLCWNNRLQLQRSELTQLEIAMRQPLPFFKNIFDYNSLTKYAAQNIPLYQLFGSVTRYNVLHISATNFIEMINEGVPLQISVPGTNIIIQLDYRPYDFWNAATHSIVQYIATSQCTTHE